MQVRYNGADVTSPVDYRIDPNPIVIDKGVIPHNELAGLTGNPEYFHTYIVKIVRHTFPAFIAQALAIATPGTENKFTVEYALRPGAPWQISKDGGNTWIQLRVLGDHKDSPVRHIFELVPFGLGRQ